MNTTIIILGLLFLKHWVADFVLQTDSQIASKGIYGKWIGLTHSLTHGGLTFLVFLPWTFTGALIAGALDTVLHYHIDYVKRKFGNQEMKNKKFWIHLGLDQLAHNLTYLLLILLITI